MDRFRIVAIVMIWAMLLGQGECERMDQMQKKNPAASQGAETEALQSLRLSLGTQSLNKDHNTTLSLTGTYADGTRKDLSARARWLVTPQDAIKITGHTLTALRDVNVTLQAQVGDKLSNPVHLEIYWEVNGHRLPPEPDPKVNNATLLGVDVNHNGVRDDVERKVYVTYKKAIERAVMMQAFRTEQAMLADPDLVKHAREWAKKEDKVINCNEYLKWYKNQKRMRNIYKFVNNVQFNTEERVRKFFKYDKALSGGVYSVGDPTLQDCEFDVEKVLEMNR